MSEEIQEYYPRMFLRKLLKTEASPADKIVVCLSCKISSVRKQLYRVNGTMIPEFVACQDHAHRFEGRPTK